MAAGPVNVTKSEFAVRQQRPRAFTAQRMFLKESIELLTFGRDPARGLQAVQGLFLRSLSDALNGFLKGIPARGEQVGQGERGRYRNHLP